MDMRGRFLRLVVIAVIGLGVVLMVQITMGLTVPLAEGEISYFNLLVDVAVGFFTIWGLYWAASELALKPELRLSIETTWSGESWRKLRGNVLIGSEEKGLLECDLFLMNTQPRAARNIQVVLCCRSFPPVPHFSASPVKGAFTNWVPFGSPRCYCLRAQFGGDLVIYKGEAVHVGILKVGWPHHSDYRPREITFEVGCYSLEGEPKKEVISLPVIWV